MFIFMIFITYLNCQSQVFSRNPHSPESHQSSRPTLSEWVTEWLPSLLERLVTLQTWHSWNSSGWQWYELACVSSENGLSWGWNLPQVTFPVSWPALARIGAGCQMLCDRATGGHVQPYHMCSLADTDCLECGIWPQGSSSFCFPGCKSSGNRWLNLIRCEWATVRT